MKKLNKKRAQKLMIMSIAALVMIFGLIFMVSPSKATIGAPVAALVIGGVTLGEKESAMFEAMQASIATEVKKYTAGYVSEEHMKEAVNELIKKALPDLSENEKFKALEQALADQGLKLKALTEKPINEPEFKSINQQIKDFFKANPNAIKDFQDNPNGSISMDLKVAGSMIPSTNISGTTPSLEIEQGLIRPLLTRQFIFPLCNVGRTGKESYMYTQMVNRDGNAAIINDTTIAPLVDFDIATTITTAHDSVGSTTVHANMLEDLDYMETEIKDNLSYECDLALDDGVIAYIIGTAAGAFADPGIDIPTPNNFDCILACSTQIEALNGMANLAIVHPADYASMVGSKGSNGQYVLPPFSTPNGTVISDCRLVKSNRITPGNVLVMDSTKMKVNKYSDYKVTFGWDGANGFRNRIICILGVRRDHFYVPSNHTPCFVYDSFADIKEAIGAL